MERDAIVEAATREPKMGGGSLSIVGIGGSDLVDSLLSSSEGGRKLDRGVKGRIHEAFGIEVHVNVAQLGSGGAAGALQAVRALAAATIADNGSPTSVGVQTPPDIVVLSLDPRHDGDSDVFCRDLRELINVVKNELSAHVVAFNSSTIDHDDLTSNYTGVNDTPALRLHRLNLALMRLSVEEGISIVDVDRLIADIGANGHVKAMQDYSEESCGLICDEFIRVVADYGFFEQRPLVAQLGRGHKGLS